jgi:hypothetical protein
VECRLLLNVVVRKCVAVLQLQLQLLVRDYQALAVRRDARGSLERDLRLDALDGLRALNLERDRLAVRCLDEDLHDDRPYLCCGA